MTAHGHYFFYTGTTVYCTVPVRKGGVIFFLIWQKTAPNQRSGMILEVQIQIFGARAAKLSFSLKIPGGLNFNIFCENRHEALLHKKNKRRKTNSKFEF